MIKIIYISLISFVIIFPLVSFAQPQSSCKTSNGEVCLYNPLTGKPSADTPNQLIGQIINGVLGVVGSLALVMFIYGGFMWMMAAGSNERVPKGKVVRFRGITTQ